MTVHSAPINWLCLYQSRVYFPSASHVCSSPSNSSLWVFCSSALLSLVFESTNSAIFTLHQTHFIPFSASCKLHPSWLYCSILRKAFCLILHWIHKDLRVVSATKILSFFCFILFYFSKVPQRSISTSQHLNWLSFHYAANSSYTF